MKHRQRIPVYMSPVNVMAKKTLFIPGIKFMHNSTIAYGHEVLVHN